MHTVLKAEIGAEENSRRRRDLRRAAVAICEIDRERVAFSCIVQLEVLGFRVYAEEV